jgi:hypothetical protein
MVGTGFTEGVRDSEASRAAGVGVPARDREGRGFIGGGPMEPSMPRTGFEAEALMGVPFTRELFPRARGLVVDPPSEGVERPFPRPISVPESDIAEGGRESGTLLVNIDESRR